MRTMVIVAHPRLEQSRANRKMAEEARKLPGVIVRDLYREYPDWRIDVEKEQRQLLEVDRIVMQFPFYWYSCPPLLKKWMDDVLTPGWAYGPGGDRLEGKQFIVATTTGGSEEGYGSDGYNRHTVGDLLRPIRNTVLRCRGTYLPEFVAYGVTHNSEEGLALDARRYAAHIHSALG